MNWRAILKNHTHQENKENQEYRSEPKSNIPDILDIIDGEELKSELKEEGEYLFFERLGISNNEKLALDESFNHIIKKLTIQ